MQRDGVLTAEVSPSAENAPFLRVAWVRRPFASEFGPVVFDVRRLPAEAETEQQPLTLAQARVLLEAHTQLLLEWARRGLWPR